MPDYLSYVLNRPGEVRTVVAKRTVFVMNFRVRLISSSKHAARQFLAIVLLDLCERLRNCKRSQRETSGLLWLQLISC
ncbi:hypothetical protein [Acidithrix sp. C25]|uniref:hypothetical protein n=1 Tax=Acidithrix sp. C25 TaxID=1671482 RepID=UPI00191BA739|nr:hypothetical protein [Acidithrix sp. C25]